MDRPLYVLKNMYKYFSAIYRQKYNLHFQPFIEGVKLAGLKQKHILSPWAMTWDGSSPMFIYPYAAQGNLKQFLTKFAQAGLSTHQIVGFGNQMLSAMAHMHKRKLIHKDIATRNCL